MYYVVIPAYEPDEKLLTLLQEMNQHLNCKVVVVNDGSSLACQSLFEQATFYATVLHHEENKGKGQALRTAFRYIADLNESVTIVTADADGQHSLVDIDRVAHASMNLPNRLILGVREFTNDIPLRSRFGNKLTRVLFKLQTNVAVSDTQTGLRAFHSQLLSFMLEIEGDRYEYEMNMLTHASKRYAITEIPIQTIYIDDNASSHFRPVRDGLMIYKNLFQFALTSLSGFLIDYVVYVLALLLLTAFPSGIRLLVANTLARVISSVSNFSLNKTLVFKNRDSLKKTGPSYFLLAGILFLCDTALLYIFYQLLGINLYLVKILVGLLLFFVSWFVQKKIIFRERKLISHEVY